MEKLFSLLMTTNDIQKVKQVLCETGLLSLSNKAGDTVPSANKQDCMGRGVSEPVFQHSFALGSCFLTLCHSHSCINHFSLS